VEQADALPPVAHGERAFREVGRLAPLLRKEDVESFTTQGRWNDQGKKWVVSVDNPPHFGAATAEGHSRTEAKDGITDLLAMLLGHRNFNVQVSFEEELRG
jgi:hypothetical protein